MYKYRKKPVVIEAFQMTKERRQDNSDWPTWLHQAWQKENNEENSLNCGENSDGKDQLWICTLEGVMKVNWNDWIIQGVNKEIYPCKPDIFEKTYEKMEEESQN